MFHDAWQAVAESVVFNSPLNLSPLEKLDRSIRVIDLGCGYGRNVLALQAEGFTNVVGYDKSEALVRRGLAEHPELSLHVADACAVPEASVSAGLVVLAGLLTCMPDRATQASLVREIRRVLVPGGVVAGVEFQRSAFREYDQAGCFHSSAGVPMRHYEPYEICELFTEVGQVNHHTIAAESLSGTPERVIQFFVGLKPNKL